MPRQIVDDAVEEHAPDYGVLTIITGTIFYLNTLSVGSTFMALWALLSRSLPDDLLESGEY